MRWLPLILVLGCNGGEEECTDWFCEDGATSATGNGTGKTGTGKTGTGKTGTGKTGTATFTLSFELDPDTGEGLLVFEGDDCASSYAVDQAEPRQDCESCDFAFEVTAGDLGNDAAPCADDDKLVGVVYGLGHEAPGTLHYDKDGWVNANDFGTSSVSGDLWMVTLPYL